MPVYWIDFEAKTTARMADLDRFLRRLWLECCGHLSAFRVGSTMYTTPIEEPFLAREERSLSTKVEQALAGVTGWFSYEYDFGSTTMLRLRIVDARDGAIGRSTVRLLARNVAPAWRCSVCGEPAAFVCASCMQETEDYFVCRGHAEGHDCEAGDEALLPVVNSPRMGVCGYTGDVGP